VVVPSEAKNTSSFVSFIYDNFNSIALYILFFIIIVILLIKRKRGHFLRSNHRKIDAVNELKEEIQELEDTSRGLRDELNDVKALEENIKEKIKNIER
jgi:septation ring formation regulator EzrA